MKRQSYNRHRITFSPVLILTLCLLLVHLNALAQQKGNAFAPASSSSRDDRESIAINTDLVSLRISVTDKQGRAVPELEQSAFAVYEDGVQQEISFFSDQDDPAAIGIILDVSGSMTGKKILRAREALTRFIQTSHEADEYFLIGFNESPQLLLDDVRGNEALLARISGIKPTGNTALYDAVAFGLEQVARSPLHKRALIVISDGEDNHSRLNFRQVRRRLRESDVTIYTVLISSSLPRSSGEAVMNDLAAASGGKSYVPGNAEKMSEAFEEIALELRREYSLGYSPSNFVADGKWHRIKVDVVPSAMRTIVRTRGGYYARMSSTSNSPWVMAKLPQD